MVSMEGAREKNRDDAPLVIGRYALFDIIAAGGMATVHIGRLLGPVGFCRTVAVKRLHPMFARDPEFVSMFLDEARLAARIRHPHVIQTVDVVATKGELFVVMDYVEGESLSRLMRALRERGDLMPLRVVSAIVSGALQGLHAAHEAKDERGDDLGIVHRDVSPQNVLVGIDGLARVLDFGIAKATGRMQTTREGQVKGKLAYMAPEQVHGETMTRTADIYAAAIVAWEAITAQRLFRADSESAVLAKVLAGEVAPPSSLVPEVPKQLDAVIMRGLARDPALRFATAKEMAQALEKCVPPASSAEVAEWLAPILGPLVADRATLVAQIETDSGLSSLESLKERMLKELTVPPVVRTTTRLESAAQQSHRTGRPDRDGQHWRAERPTRARRRHLPRRPSTRQGPRRPRPRSLRAPSSPPRRPRCRFRPHGAALRGGLRGRRGHGHRGEPLTLGKLETRRAHVPGRAHRLGVAEERVREPSLLCGGLSVGARRGHAQHGDNKDPGRKDPFQGIGGLPRSLRACLQRRLPAPRVTPRTAGFLGLRICW